MDHPAHVTLVDAHAKGDGGADHEQLVVLEHLLCLIALEVGESGMIRGSVDTFLTQVLGHLLCGFPTQTIDNACFQRAGFDEVKDEVHLLGSLITAFDGETKVRTVEAGDELTGIMQVELFDDVMSGNFISSSCQCHDRRLGEFLAEDAQLGVFRTEVMSPLTDTVGFVDGKERDVDMAQQIVNLRQKFFWGDVK